uniref:TAP binding protein like n=1 Tax=Prolemur simus TaxID=1328070 RepID=A0A8C9A6T7_PROSS
MGSEEGWCLLLCLALSAAAETVDLIQIPQAEALLHADCSGKEVTCEISRYFLQAREATAETAARFITNMQVSGGGPSISVVMKILGDADSGAVRHPTLSLPLSPWGTVQTAVEFQVTTPTQSLTYLLGSSASLDCSFCMAPGLDLINVEWRLQHEGSGGDLHLPDHHLSVPSSTNHPAQCPSSPQ